MKRLKYIVISVLLALCALLFAACNDNSLDTPSGLKVDVNKDIITWNEVSNATRYSIQINGSERYSTKTSYSIANLSAGSYKVRIKAMSNRDEFSDSSWSSYVNFVIQQTSGIKYALTNGNTEYIAVGLGSARGEVVIEDTYKGLPVTSIADKAFYATSSALVTGVTIGKNVKKIGNYAFANCTNMEYLVLSDSLTQIGEGAFQSCRGLTELNLPESVTEIKPNAFKYCRGLKSITLGSKTVKISDEAFADCDALESIVIPDSVETVGQNAFYSCESLTEINIGSGVSELGASAFEACEKLTSIKGGSSLNKIGSKAFAGCSSLTSVAIGDSVETVGSMAFYYCENLADVTVGSGVRSLGHSAFYGTKLIDTEKLGIVYVDDWLVDVIEDYDEEGNRIALPDYTIRNGTVGIADRAFFASAIEGYLSLPDSVKYIGQYSFSKCEKLGGINTGTGIVSIGSYAFYNCTVFGRRDITLGPALEKIGNYAFYSCKDLGKYRGITIPQSVTEIGTYAFKDTSFWNDVKKGVVYVDKWVVGYIDDDKSLDDVLLRDDTVGIANYAFYETTSVGTLQVNDGLVHLGKCAFYGCLSLIYVSFGERSSVTEISDYAFYKCSSLLNISLPNRVRKIGRSAFYKSGLTTVAIPARVTEIDDFAFFGCPHLSSVGFTGTSQLKSIGSKAFAYCPVLGSDGSKPIKLPDSLERLGEMVFYKCSELRSVEFGSGLTEIGAGVFNQCTALESIALPDGITEIPDRMFYKCTSLKSVDFGTVKSIGKNAFFGCAALCELDLSGITEIGEYAFRKCTGLKSVFLNDGITNIGAHAFNGCSYLTLYVQGDATGEQWSARWNSGYRPVLFGCELSANGYVETVELKDGALMYENAKNGISGYYREGYDFVGWVAEDGTVFTSAELAQAPYGKYTLRWTEHVEPPPQEEPEEGPVQE